MPTIEWLLTTTSFSICQMILLSMTYVPYEQSDLDIILKVTTAKFIILIWQIYTVAQIFYKQVIKLFWVYCCLLLQGYQHRLTQVIVTYMLVTRGQNISHQNTIKNDYQPRTILDGKTQSVCGLQIPCWTGSYPYSNQVKVTYFVDFIRQS